MHKLLSMMLLIFSLQSLSAQQLFPTVNKDEQSPPQYHVQLNEAVVVATQVFANDTDRYHFNQLKYYIKTVMPYVLASVSLFNEITDASSNMSERNRKKYIKTREREIKENFEDKLSSLNITQGRLLVKLVNRQQM